MPRFSPFYAEDPFAAIAAGAMLRRHRVPPATLSYTMRELNALLSAPRRDPR
jgi:hypothetical protein